MWKEFPDCLSVKQAQAGPLEKQLRKVRCQVRQEEAACPPLEDCPLHRHSGEILLLRLLLPEVCEEAKPLGTPGRAHIW